MLTKENDLLKEEVEAKKETPTFTTVVEDLIIQKKENDELFQENRDLKNLKLNLNKDILSAISLSEEKNISKIINAINSGRLANAFDEDLATLTLEDLKITAIIKSNKKDPQKNGKYKVDLSAWSCTCEDIVKRKAQMCKHQLYAAYSIGLLQSLRNEDKKLVQALVDQTKKENQKIKIKI